MRLSLILLAAMFATAQPSIAQTDPSVEKDSKSNKVPFTQMEIAAAKKYPLAFTIDPTTIEIVNLGPTSNAKSETQKPGSQPPAHLPSIPESAPKIPESAGEDPFVYIDKIINTAKKIWEIIEKNKPVVDISTTYANAVPSGLTHWTQLNEWKAPEGTIYGFRAKNLYGAEMINVRYQVLRTYGGNYKGKGKYLTAVTVVPLSVDVGWGYSFAMSAEAPSVANMGTADDPMASMILNLNWKIATAVKEARGTSVYFLQGDGQFKELGGPFKKMEAQRLSKKLQSLNTVF